MPRTVVEAIYESGVLRLARPIDLADGTPVEVVVTPRAEIDPVPTGTPDPAEILDEILAIPIEAPDRSLHGRDHDEILYGRGGAR